MPEWMQDSWKVAAAFVAFIVWLVRLEAKGLQNEREIKRLWNQRNPGHCERADRKDYERAKRKVAAYERAKK